MLQPGLVTPISQRHRGHLCALIGRYGLQLTVIVFDPFVFLDIQTLDGLLGTMCQQESSHVSVAFSYVVSSPLRRPLALSALAW